MLRKAADVPYPSGSSCGSRIYLSLFLQAHYRDLVHPAARQIEPAITCCYHVAHHPASRGNRLRTETLRLGIKSDQRVRLDAPSSSSLEYLFGGNAETSRLFGASFRTASSSGRKSESPVTRIAVSRIGRGSSDSRICFRIGWGDYPNPWRRPSSKPNQQRRLAAILR